MFEYSEVGKIQLSLEDWQKYSFEKDNRKQNWSLSQSERKVHLKKKKISNLN